MLPDINIILLESEQPERAKKLKEMLNNVIVRSGLSINHRETIEHLGTLKPDLIIIDPSLDPDSSLRAIQKVKILDPATPVLTSFYECVSDGDQFTPFQGIHYIDPDCDQATLEDAINEALAFRASCGVSADSTFIIGKSRGIAEVRRKIKKIAEKDITVLVTGETGTGKELVARSLHFFSNRKECPLVKVDCTSLPDELLESEIFGFQKGAFTDAYQDKPGRLEMANGGTLFIDEIGDLSLSLQVKLLQVFEDKEFTRLGGTEDQPINVRVVAATNANLWKKVKEKEFRDDLFYRLSVMHIEIPPLRKRKEDILILSNYFINKYSFEYKRKPLEMPDEVVNYFLKYHWPGNIRELENIIRRAVAFSSWDFVFNEIKVDEVPDDGEPGFTDSQYFQEDAEEFDNLLKENDYSLKKVTRLYVSDVEIQAIKAALKVTNWNRTKAAKLLGVSYKTLINRIQEFSITP